MFEVTSPSSARRPRPEGRSTRRVIHAVLALGCLLVGATGAVGACSSSTSTPGEDCVGGVMVNGACEGKCRPELCLEGNTCVGNRCTLKCDSHLECYPGVQECAPATEDDTNAAIMVCTYNDKPTGYGAKCPFGTECGDFGACPDGSPCSPTQCGGDLFGCTQDPSCNGDPACTTGTCQDGSACYFASCSPAECAPAFVCHGAGEGDADAYCTQNDCQADADCPGGFQCAITLDPHEICNSMPKKGNSSHCGETNEPCLDKSTFGNGNTYMEGSLCILRNTCVKRTQCASCQTDLDCSLVEGQRCVDIGGSNHCARSCNTDPDCDPDYRCEANACVPRFGACTGQGNFCEPCQSDNDCGGPESTRGCAELSGGQHACFDYAFPDTCTTDADCPKSPSGKNGECLDEGEGLGPTDSLYHRCYLPYNATDNKFGCW